MFGFPCEEESDKCPCFGCTRLREKQDERDREFYQLIPDQFLDLSSGISLSKEECSEVAHFLLPALTQSEQLDLVQRASDQHLPERISVDHDEWQRTKNEVIILRHGVAAIGGGVAIAAITSFLSYPWHLFGFALSFILTFCIAGRAVKQLK